MLSAYPACFIKEDAGYSVIFPDLNHLATCGQTLDEACTMAIDCLAGYLYHLEQDDEPVPAASPLNQIVLTDILRDLELESCEAFVNMVTVDVARYKTLTIPAWLNSAALEQNINFSQVLQEALKAQLHLG